MTECTRSYCGLDCSACPIYRYSHGGDGGPTADEIVVSWNALLGYAVRPEELYCDGCNGERKFVHCRSCTFVECAVAKGLAACSDCAEKATCARLAEFTNWFRENERAFLFDSRKA